jgi:hypothetical protein
VNNFKTARYRSRGKKASRNHNQKREIVNSKLNKIFSTRKQEREQCIWMPARNCLQLKTDTAYKKEKVQMENLKSRLWLPTSDKLKPQTYFEYI